MDPEAPRGRVPAAGVDTATAPASRARTSGPSSMSTAITRATRAEAGGLQLDEAGAGGGQGLGSPMRSESWETFPSIRPQRPVAGR